MIADRYDKLFTTGARAGSTAVIPFLVIGDPDAEEFLRRVDALVEAGADALELGFPFSDPVADGPVVVAAGQRALAAGITPDRCLSLLCVVRQRHPDIPIGLLVYANLLYARGLDRFYADAADAGVDSILVPDAPAREIAPFRDAANDHGIAQVLIAPPDASTATLTLVAELGAGYTYVLGRRGVTGSHQRIDATLAPTVQRLLAADAPPAVIGFGITDVASIESARVAGAAGVIVGSALIEALDHGVSVQAFLQPLVAAART